MDTSPKMFCFVLCCLVFGLISGIVQGAVKAEWVTLSNPDRGGVGDTGPYDYGVMGDALERISTRIPQGFEPTWESLKKNYRIPSAWPGTPTTSIASVSNSLGRVEKVELIGAAEPLSFSQGNFGLTVNLPEQQPGKHSFVLNITGLEITPEAALSFDFGSGTAASGYTQVLPTMAYTEDRGFGFEPEAVIEAIDRGGDDTLRSDFVTSDKPFLFSVRLPEGNYKVTLIVGDAEGESAATVKAEMRRLMLEKVETKPGQFQTRTIAVNIRTPRIEGGRQVRLKDRERTTEAVAWDDKLTLEFNGKRPCLCALQIERVENIPTVYLLGDSTVCDQPLEPWNSWGQMLTRFFEPEAAIANYAQSGESIRSSLGAGRFDKVWSIIKPGDYLFVQFGHNDMKSQASDALETYRKDLVTIVAEARKRGAVPVLLTSMERKGGIVTDTLGRYPEIVRDVAAETGTALIDLHAMSKALYKALGTNLDNAFQDGTHHTNYGSYELAKCVVQGIKDSGLDLSRNIVDDFQSYNPNDPDSFESFAVPPSPMRTAVTPLGS